MSDKTTKTEPVLAEPKIQEVGNNPQNANHPAFTNLVNILDEATKLASAGGAPSGQDKSAPVEKEVKHKTERVSVESVAQDGEELPKKSENKRAAEASSDQPRKEGSAIEDFRTSALQERQDRFRQLQEQKSKQKEQPKDEEAKADDGEAEKEKQHQSTDVKSDESKPDEPKADESKPEKPVTMAEIEKELAENSALSKRHRERMQFLAKRAKERDELEAQVNDLKTKSASLTSSEDLKKIQENLNSAEKELLQYRRRYSLESDPEIKKKFDEVIADADKSIEERFKKVGLSDKTIELVKSFGGFDAFAQSNTLLTIPKKNEIGEMVGEESVPAHALMRSWLNSMPVADAQYIQAKFIEKYNTIDAKRREVDRLSSEAEAYFKEQNNKAVQAAEAQKNTLSENVGKYNTWRKDWEAKQAWLSDVSIDPAASEQDRKSAEQQNQVNAVTRQLLEKAASVSSLEDYTALVASAATAPHLGREVARLTQEVARLKTQLEGKVGAVRTVPKAGGSSIQQNVSHGKKKTASEELKTPAAQSIRDELEQLVAQGGRSGYSSETE